MQLALNFSDADVAICDALLVTCTPLPNKLLDQVRAAASNSYSGATLQMVTDAIDRQKAGVT